MKPFRVIFLLISSILLNQRCKELNLCKDKEFDFPRIDNSGKTLRINGYYYGDLSKINPDNPDVYILNQNGIFINRRSFKLKDIRSGNINLEIGDLSKKHKGDWGLYKIEGNQIEIQYWTSRPSGCVGVFTVKGNILNDSIFKITTWKNSDDKKSHNVDAIFKFVAFSPKPDSTVSFIP